MAEVDFQDPAGHRARMRARLLNGGAQALLDVDVLEYLLALAIPRKDTKPLARRLLDEFGSVAQVISAQVHELERIEGLGAAGISALKLVQDAALRLLRADMEERPLLSSWQAVLDYLRAAMGHQINEAFRVLFINNRNILIRDEVMGEGTINQSAVYPREVIRRALELGAASLVLVHNHPSGDAKPSREDIDITMTIQNAARPLGIALHDHIIIARDQHCSFRTLGLL